MTGLILEAFNKALLLFEKAGKNLDLLPEAVATFLIVHAAQGVIDNGGYRYFFEVDWPKNPPYSKFIEAYVSIGCDNQAKDLARVVATFPFAAPHLHAESRQKYMDENYDQDEHEVKTWGNKLCGDREVWKKLEDFSTAHARDFV